MVFSTGFTVSYFSGSSLTDREADDISTQRECSLETNVSQPDSGYMGDVTEGGVTEGNGGSGQSEHAKTGFRPLSKFNRRNFV